MLELMVVITVSTILLTIGIPSFMRMVAQNQRAGHTADVYSALNFARSEAIARNVQVVMCKSSNASQCSSSASWSDGWIVYANIDGDTGGGEPDAPNELVLQSRGALDGFSLTSDALPARVVYLPTGRSLEMGELLLCPDKGDLNGRLIQVTSTGRARTAPAPCTSEPSP